jgi:hypothetical protein
MSIKKNSQSRVAALKPFWRASAYDYLILVLALFLFIGAFHLHVALTVGDWDFWADWKDRQWWPLERVTVRQSRRPWAPREMMRFKTLYDRLGGYDAITAVANDLLPRSQASRTAITRSGGPSKGLPYWNSSAFQALT